jgi:UDP-N-acetylglucosamine:LPS N-acetylglucosamine transferase
MYEPLIDIIRDIQTGPSAAGLHPRKPQTHPHFHIVLGTSNAHLHDAFASLPQTTVYDFVDQETMGKLLLQADVAITRGGTTSLAEQQLFDIRKIIIPIPWTHDQKKNAMYYRDQYDDIVVLQDSLTYNQDFLSAVITASTHKKHMNSDIAKNIQQPKEIISSYLLKGKP